MLKHICYKPLCLAEAWQLVVLLALVLAILSAPLPVSAAVDLKALQEQVSQEQAEAEAAAAAAAEKQRQLDAAEAERRRQEAAAAAEKRRQAEQERQRQRAAAERERKLQEFVDPFYADIGFSWNSGDGNVADNDLEVGQIYYESAMRYYLEFGYQATIGLGLRLVGTRSNYFLVEDIELNELHDNFATGDGVGYGLHLNMFCCLTIGVNKITLDEQLEFDDGTVYDPGLITETVLGLHTPATESFLYGFEYITMAAEHDQLLNAPSGVSLVWLRIRLGG